MKKCYKCQKIKELNCFSKNITRKDGLSDHCKLCHTIMRSDHYKKNKNKIIQQVLQKKQEYFEWFHSLKTAPCKDCGNTYPHYCMDFDHLRDKKFSVSVCKGQRFNKQKVLDEIKKCELVCAICHRKRTWNRAHSKT